MEVDNFDHNIKCYRTLLQFPVRFCFGGGVSPAGGGIYPSAGPVGEI
jgi:hypothetical protein